MSCKFNRGEHRAYNSGAMVGLNIFYSSQDMIKDQAERKAKFALSMKYAIVQGNWLK